MLDETDDETEQKGQDMIGNVYSTGKATPAFGSHDLKWMRVSAQSGKGGPFIDRTEDGVGNRIRYYGYPGGFVEIILTDDELDCLKRELDCPGSPE